MEKEFVSYEQAVALRELGFDEPCFGSYQLIETRDYKNGLEISHAIGLIVLNGLRNHNYKDEITNAPLKQQVFRWLREEYGLFHDVYQIAITAADKSGSRYKWDVYNYSFIEGDSEIIGYLTYEEAENACMDKLIELAKSIAHHRGPQGVQGPTGEY